MAARAHRVVAAGGTRGTRGINAVVPPRIRRAAPSVTPSPLPFVPDRADVHCNAKKGKSGESYVFQVIRGDDEEDEMLFRRFKRAVVSGHLMLEARRRKYFESKIDRKKRKMKMKALERKMRSPIITMAQRRELEAAGKIPGYNPLTRSPFLADIEPMMPDEEDRRAAEEEVEEEAGSEEKSGGET